MENEKIETEVSESKPVGRPHINRQITGTLSLERWIAAIIKNHGVKYQIAKDLGIDRKTLTTYLKKNPELERIRADCKEDIIDEFESIIYEDKTVETAKWALPRLAWDRGWSEKVEVNQKIMQTNLNANMNLDFSKLSEEELELAKKLFERAKPDSSDPDSD
jgi:DNA-binding MarR family transcriptional regulator